MKRFYREVAVQGDAAALYGLYLDGKPVRTPAKRPFLMPTLALAESIAAEWRAQGPELVPSSMPLMQLAGTAIDLVAERQAEIVAQTAKFAETDLLCYRATEPEQLVERQAAAWDPELDWARQVLGAPLTVTSGIIPVDQPAESLAAFAAALDRLELFELTGVSALAAACGSLVLALAVQHGRLDGGAAFALSQIDELYQVERWGEDEEATQRRAGLQADIEAEANFLTLLRSGVA